MKRFFIRHKVKPEDIIHLSDTDSKFVIETKSLDVEDMIEIATQEGLFLGQVTYIETASVEVEILKRLGNFEGDMPETKQSITIIQAVSNDSKFTFFIEKAVEIGVDKIIPVHSELCLLSLKDAAKKAGLWQKVIDDATEQSRNPEPPVLFDTVEISDISETLSEQLSDKNAIKICLATEQINIKPLHEILDNNSNGSSYIIAIGPEKGWSNSDLEVFRKFGFRFSSLGKNILRTETAGLVISSIINYINNKY